MNCKPGDLAVRVQAFHDSFVKVGSVVRCVELNDFTVVLQGSAGSPAIEATNTWNIEWRGRTRDARGLLMSIPDEHLRPIRDPGEDAKDETLSWLPVPSTEQEGA